MDEQRQQNMAYEYLCHLEEAKRWMEACLDEELPPTTELEEGLRNGVYLAKLGHFFAPQTVSLKKIYDREQTRYKATGLHFRHTDNVIQWLNAMSAKGLPKIFYPETTDIYDRKNMPRCIYCIHALSLYLFKLGLAPQIQDLYGKVDFTEEEINNMKSELEKYGIQMPAFSKIGGILANELSVDEAALHAAVIAINEAVDHGDPQGTFTAMQNPNAMLGQLDPESAQDYQTTLHRAKDEKMENAEAERDIYDELLTQAEIQGNVNKVNRDESPSPQTLPSTSSSRSQSFHGIWMYSHVFSLHSSVVAAVERINAAIRAGVPEKTVEELMNPEAQLPTVYPEAADLYQRELSSLQQQSPESALSHPELMVAVEMLSAVVLMNAALDRGDKAALWNLLSSPETGLSNVDQEYAQRYMEELIRLKGEGGTDFLTWNDIQACIDQVNQTEQSSNSLVLPGIAAIGEINEALDEGDAQKTLTSLQNPAAKFDDLNADLAMHYHNVLLEARREKAHVSAANTTTALAHCEYLVSTRQTESPRQHSCIQAINTAVDQGDPAHTLSALKNPGAGLYGLTSECQETYQNDLKSAKDQKAQDDGSEWVKHWVKGGHNYYYNLHSGEGTWVEPDDFQPNNSQLTKDEIQSLVSGVTTAYNREQLWRANEALISRLQARCRGYLIRRGLRERRDYLQNQSPVVTTIQVRVRVKLSKNTLLFECSFQCSFLNAGDPPMGVVRKFVHLLDSSDQDFQEELELMRLREEVVTNIRSNQSLEKDLNLMDIKIGLLVKNKITLQDVVSHSKHLTKKNHGQLSNMMSQNKTRGGSRHEKRVKMEAFRHLFYLLQTNPTYLAKLIFQMPQNKSTKFMDSVIFTLYNYASNQREEYLLLRLFRSALQEEIKSKVDQLKEVVTGNPTVIKMVVSFHRGARGQNALRQILAPVVKETIDDKALNIKTDPVDIYKGWVNHMESQTGEASKLPYDVTPEQAMSHEEVRTRLEACIKNMKTINDKFMSAITTSVDKIPYGMRFISKVLKDSLHEKFPDATEDELLKIVGNLLYYRYMNPAVVAPDAFDIIEVAAGGQLTTEQRRNLGSIAKMLQHAASSKMFLGDNAHLTPINEYLTSSYGKFRRFFLAACDVPSLEDKFNVDQYSDLVTVTKPVIYISIGEMINTHTLLLDHADAIAPDHNDPLHELLENLGEVPTVEALIGENPLPPDDPNRELLGKTEVSLTLTNKFDVSADGNDPGLTVSFCSSTKRLIVDVIRFQPGETLTEILDSTASTEQDAQTQDAQTQDAQTQDQIGTKRDLDDSLSLQGKKDKIRHNLQVLSELGRVQPQNRYQDLINDIAKDIRNQRRYRQRRKAELVRLQQTNDALNSKTNFYNAQIDQYHQYIKTCMDNLTKGKKQVSHKYTASRLHEKGVLLSIEDLQPNQFKNVIFEISRSETVGVFDVKAKLMGVHLETVQLEYQDLLQLQYEGVALMKLFDRATINVNLLIFLLNKKFYGK
uniref:IQ motif containing GTPase activating protein 1 n=1 Tax=Neogobius melanostomus TaxID=47308 RepID=A0A8C6WRL7_9GOBI